MVFDAKICFCLSSVTGIDSINYFVVHTIAGVSPNADTDTDSGFTINFQLLYNADFFRTHFYFYIRKNNVSKNKY